jgi:hypothetical protein
MKKLIMLVLLIVCLSPQNVYSNNSFYTNYGEDASQQKLYRESLFSLLYPYISSEVNKYYGFSKQFDLYKAKILSIKKTPDVFEYEITVQVEIFTGAHNPPRGIETITVLTSPMRTRAINYKHSNEEVVETDTPLNMKAYRYNEYGYEIGYHPSFDIEISGGHSPAANPEYGMRLSLYSKDSQLRLDIDSVEKVNYKDKYQSVEDFIKYKHLNIKFDEDFIINDKHNKIYKSESEDYYFSFLENEKYIFQLSSSSKDILKKIMITFKFI